MRTSSGGGGDGGGNGGGGAAGGTGGGGDGAAASNHIVRDGETITLRSKTGCRLEAGDLLVVRTGGGGGYGPEEERPADLIERDSARGLTASE